MFLRLKGSFHITLLAGSKVIENMYTSVYFLTILFVRMSYVVSVDAYTYNAGNKR